MPHDTLHVLYRALLLGQGRDRSANDLEGELRQLKIASEFVKNPLAKVVRVQEPSDFVCEDEVVR